MAFWGDLKNWVLSFRRVGGLEIPDPGRSSVEGNLSDRISTALAAFGTVEPGVSFEMLALLKKLWVCNPDLSQYVANIKNLGNNGHQLVVDAATAQRAEVAAQRLNEAAGRIYRHGAGVDGLINAYMNQVAWSGALSSEDVVDFGRRQVSKVVLVPPEQIRFRLIEGEYRPFQQPQILVGPGNPLGLIPLSEVTYRYFALDTIDNSPYAKPPASAAIESIIGPQADMTENIKFIARKLGILGLVSVSVVPPPRKPNETEAEYQSRAGSYLAAVRGALEKNFNKGLLATYKDQKVEHANVASDARGAYDIWRLNEEQVMSATAMQPVFYGRTDSSTETFADVVYMLLLAQVGNVVRLAKRRQEATYKLDLLLGGVDVADVSVQFNRPHSRNALQEAQAEQAKTQTVISKVRSGFISPDEGAQELGYEAAFDPELLAAQPEAARELRLRAGAEFTAVFRFDRAAQAYRFVPPRIEAAQAPVEAGNVVRLKKKGGRVGEREGERRSA